MCKCGSRGEPGVLLPTHAVEQLGLLTVVHDSIVVPGSLLRRYCVDRALTSLLPVDNKRQHLQNEPERGECGVDTKEAKRLALEIRPIAPDLYELFDDVGTVYKGGWRC